MEVSEEVLTRRKALEQDLSSMIRHYQSLARYNYHGAYAIRFTIIVSSLVAGIGGLSSSQPHLFAVVAFLPAALAVISSNLKLQDRANWHYRKTDALHGLRNRLLYELPDPPTSASVGEISQALTALNNAMSKEWEDLLGLDTAIDPTRRP